MLLALLMVLNVGIGALASTDVSAETDQQHPDQTADEALLADYLAGDLQYLTIDENGDLFYRGKHIIFPASQDPLRPEQEAALRLGFAPDTPMDAGAPEVPQEGLLRRFFGWFGIGRSSWPASGQITNNGQASANNDHGFASWGDWFSLTFEGQTLPAFCVQRNVAGPGTGMPHQIWDASDNPNIAILTRILYFGWGGPGNIFGSNQRDMGVISTSLVLHHIITEGNTNVDGMAASAMSGVRDLVAAVRSDRPTSGNLQVLLISTNAPGIQNLMTIRVLPDPDPEPTPTPTPPPPPPPPEEGTLQIIKTSDSGVVSGIQFHVTGPGGFSQTVTSGINGTITIPGLQPGSYRVEEQSLGSHYNAQPAQTVTVIANQTTTVSFHNTLRPGNLRIVKTSETGNVSGIQFRVTGSGINQTVTTGTDGTIDIPGLQAGVSVTITEVNIPPQYVRPQAQTVTIRPNETVTVTFHNRLLYGSVSGLKVGEDAGLFADADGLAGAVIGLFPAGTTVFSEDTALQVTTSAENGTFSFTQIPYGNFLVREISPPSAAYILNDTAFPVRIERDGQVVQILLENRLVRGTVNGHKVGESTSGLGNDFNDADGLAGVTIGIFAPDTEEFSEETALETVVTDENGHFSFTMPYGYYLIRELSTGSDAYVLSDETIQVRIDTDGQILEIRLENRLVRGNVQGSKTGETTEGAFAGLFTDREGLAGATIGLFGLVEWELVPPDDEPDEEYDESDQDQEDEDDDLEIELMSTSEDADDDDVDDDQDEQEESEDDEDSDETEEDTPEVRIISIAGIPLEDFEFTSETAVQTVITAEDGSFYFEDVIVGHWIAREVYAPEAYVLNETLFLVTITEDGEVVKVEIENELIRGDIEGVKIGEDTEAPFEGIFTDGDGLAGALIGLFHADETAFTEDTAIKTALTDEYGHFAFRDLPFIRNLVVREIAPPEGYTLNDTAFPVTIAEDGVIIEITIENTLIRGAIEGIKVCSTTGYPLEGATFGLFAPDETIFTTDTALMTSVSGADGIFGFDDLPFSSFLVRELEAPGGYLLSDETFEVEIGYDGQIVDVRAYNEQEPEDPDDPEDEPKEEDDPEEEDDPKEQPPAPRPTPTPNRPGPTAPQTGDDTQLPWFTLVLSLLGMIAIIGGAVWYRYKLSKGKSDAR